MSATLLENPLFCARRLHAEANLRAIAVWAVLESLSTKRLWLPRKQFVRDVANRLYFERSMMETYDLVEDYAEDLRAEIEACTPVETVADKDYFVFTPFFATNTTYFEPILGDLRGHSVVAFKELSRRERLELPEERAVGGLADFEVEVLRAHHLSKALEVVNLLRKLETALTYVRKGLAASDGAELYRAARWDKGVMDLVNLLGTLVKLECLPAPATHFGTEADSINPLRKIPNVEALLGELIAGNRIANKALVTAGLPAMASTEYLETLNDEPVYLGTMVLERRYNPKFGDNRVCTCGHPYGRHFDPYEDNEAVGCKYCGCDTFKLARGSASASKPAAVKESPYYDDYATVPIGGGNPYSQCKHCQVSVPAINGALKGHASWCRYRQAKEQGFPYNPAD